MSLEKFKWLSTIYYIWRISLLSALDIDDCERVGDFDFLSCYIYMYCSYFAIIEVSKLAFDACYKTW